MSHLLSLARYLPPHEYGQEEVTDWVRRWLEASSAPNLRRLLRVYGAAAVEARRSVIPIEEVFAGRDFETQNDVYIRAGREAGIEVTRDALERARIDPRDVSFLLSVSCTGFAIPSLDAYVADALGMGPALARLPITESGCAGGVVGLARADDFLAAKPDACAVVLCIELSSLTFQRWDASPTNVVSAALFGDGGAAVVLVGDRHPAAERGVARLGAFGSHFFADSTHLMGFRLRNQGLQIILDRGLAAFLRRHVAPVVDEFLHAQGVTRDELDRWILHPGGRRVIEAMVEQLGLDEADLAPTRRVLARHGNMSSVTVLFVLDEILRSESQGAERALIGAFGPGFAAELGLLELKPRPAV